MATSLLIIALILFAGDGCTANEPLQKLAFASNELALNLHRKLVEGSSQNVFFSPLSISTAFGMLFYGARGNTAKELRRTLGYAKAEMPDSLVHATFHRFLTEVLKSGNASNSYVLNSANALLLDRKLDVLPDYKNEVEYLYQASVGGVNFGSDGVVNNINRWVKYKTNGKIENFVDELDPKTRMIILNAVYFKGTWKTQFEPEKTELLPFYNKGLESQVKNVPMMQIYDRFRYLFIDDIQALQLPYKGDNISMVILLPTQRDGLAALESSLTLDKFNTVLQHLYNTKVDVALPKFKAEFSKELTGEFKSLGASGIFRPGSADLSGITSSENLYVTEVLHQAVVEVNEEGSEATAATQIVVGGMSASFTPRFAADHPFMYFIVKHGIRSNMILFMGRVNSL